VRDASQVAAKGSAHPVGATPMDGGVNFSVFSEYADAVELLLFARPDDASPARVVELTRDFHFWHTFVAGVRPGTAYAFRAAGSAAPPFAFDHEKALLDPYAREIVGTRWNRAAAAAPGDNVAASLRAVVVASGGYDWEGDRPLNRPIDETVIYELHVGGFTRSPTSGVARPGTFAALAEKIPYIAALGVTAVELLPVFAFDPTDGDYWGYNPVAHFAPHPPYGTADELRDLVKAMHRAGLEVILDVVYNHTGEGDAGGPTISLRGLANEAYYMHAPERPEVLLDFSGCGNTLDANDPIVTKLVFDSLCYWVDELHVDGFRFDEASVLTRAPDGSIMRFPPLVELAELADQLGETKLIAEAWDAGGAYELGTFPGRRWSEWNGRFRDDIRRFVRGDPGLVGAVATRVGGSSDIYGKTRRPPTAGVSFVTCHDGFTLNDLVSYGAKHNEANGEQNRDGTDDNLSWNCGVEGPTDDPQVEALRERQLRNFAVVLLVSRGVPMILAGDEARRTQRGNNNPYNQDNETSWFDWTLVDRHGGLLRFWRLLLDFRRRHPALRAPRFYDGTPNEHGAPDIAWHGCLLGRPGFDDPSSRVLAFTVDGAVHVILNMDDHDLEFELDGRPWRRAFDTSLRSPDDASEPGREPPVADPRRYRAIARSSVVLVAD
jgi:glycogen operon protein